MAGKYKNTVNTSSLIKAVSEKNEAWLKSCLARNDRLDIRLDLGQTALHIAAWKGWIPGVTALVEAGADLEDRDEAGSSPLIYAIIGKHPKIVSLLIERGASIHVRDNHNATPLHIAAKMNHIEIIDLLASSTQDIDPQNNEGQTPLLLAVSLKKENAILRLLEHGANIHARQNDGLGVLDLLKNNRILGLCRAIVENRLLSNNDEQKLPIPESLEEETVSLNL